MKADSLNNRALLYLTLSLVLTLQMHLDRLPVWILMAALGSVVWRYGIYLGRLSSPHWSVKGVLVMLGFTGIYLTYGQDLSIESMVSLLVAGFALKPLEIEKRADSYVLIFLSYLLIGLHFLFEQGPLDYLWVIFVLIVVLTTQIVINQNNEYEGSDQQKNDALWQAASLFLKSLPLAAFLFFVLPRLGPLWVLNIPTSDGVIGLSNSMSPGQIAELGKSNDLAFRVKFNSDVPRKQDQYWRALVLDYFDGETWSQKYQPDIDWHPVNSSSTSAKKDVVDYEVLLQPHDETWLFSLGVAMPVSSGIGVSEDARLISKRPIHGQIEYHARSNLNLPMQQQSLPALSKKHYLQMPDEGNERTRQFAQSLKQQFSSVEGFTHALRQYFNTTEFFYTLEPGRLDSDSTIDEFLFESQRGFCAHYAGSLVFMMRAVGIPARVVVGYLGLEENPVANFHSVYQYNAHAWVEIWVQGRGWLKIDPTGWVAPERIDKGLEEAINQEFVGFSTNSEWLRGMRNQINALNFYWNDWMLNYKGAAQQELINKMFGERSELELIMLVLACIFSAIGFGFVFLLLDFKRPKLSIEQKLLSFYKIKLQRSGIEIPKNSSLTQISILAINYNPKLKQELDAIKKAFEYSLYVKPNSKMSKIEYASLKKSIIRLAKKLTKVAVNSSVES